MPNCVECQFYKPLENKPGFGLCFGVEIPGDRNIKDSPKCKGKYFKPRKG